MKNLKLDPADIKFSQWIRLRDGQCLRCGSLVRLNDEGFPVSHNASHFQGRGKESTRFSPDNVCCLCFGCHQYLGSNPAEHYDWQVQRLGKDKVDMIVRDSNRTQKKQRDIELIYWTKKLKEDFGL